VPSLFPYTALFRSARPAGRRRDHLDVFGLDDQGLGRLVHVEGVGRLHHDRVPGLEPGDVLEDPAVGVAVPGDRDVADLPGQRGLRIVPAPLTLSTCSRLTPSASGNRGRSKAGTCIVAKTIVSSGVGGTGGGPSCRGAMVCASSSPHSCSRPSRIPAGARSATTSVQHRTEGRRGGRSAPSVSSSSPRIPTTPPPRRRARWEG